LSNDLHMMRDLFLLKGQPVLMNPWEDAGWAEDDWWNHPDGPAAFCLNDLSLLVLLLTGRTAADALNGLLDPDDVSHCCDDQDRMPLTITPPGLAVLLHHVAVSSLLLLRLATHRYAAQFADHLSATPNDLLRNDLLRNDLLRNDLLRNDLWAGDDSANPPNWAPYIALFEGDRTRVLAPNIVAFRAQTLLADCQEIMRAQFTP